MKRVLIPGVILCGADVAQAVDDKNMYMHVFEEMTVYAPVPVPVNGNTHYTSESIERLPTGNGNISDLLRTNPAVRMDSTQSTSLNQGDIRPEKISIHGASPYQNAYLIDGISATNNLNPANESDARHGPNCVLPLVGIILVIIPVTIMTYGTPNFHVHMVIFQGVAPVAD